MIDCISMEKPPSTEEVRQRLEKVLVQIGCSTQYSLVQVNGQRKMLSNKYEEPPEGCEVFVGRLPRDLFEDELVPPFLRMGPIYEVRTMMNFSGSNRGFAFIRYRNQESAQRAIKTLNNFEIRKGRFIGVLLSVNNRRLCLEGLDARIFDGNMMEYLLMWIPKMTPEVEEIMLPSNKCAFVLYKTHRDAAMARRLLIPVKNKLFGPKVMIDWADPRF